MAKPFIEEKEVILCRSGIQFYRENELVGLNLINERPAGMPQKQEYKIMRHKSPIISAVEKFRRLPLTKEHPPEDVTPANWKRYAEGSTGSFVDVVNLEGGEIGLKSDCVFNTNDIYNYYLDGNREVSVGYTNDHRWVENWEEVGYDIELVSINEVNHLAVTMMGRGGRQVSIIDSLIGGIRMLKLKSGILGFLNRKGVARDSVTPFSTTVFEALEKTRKMDEKGAEAVLLSVHDSLASFKETATRTLLCDSVADLFAAPDLALAKKVEVSGILDSMYEKAEKETNDAFETPAKDSPEGTDDAAGDEGTDDSAGEGDDEKDKGGTKDEDGKGKGTANISDSALDSVIASVKQSVNDSVVAQLEAFRGEISGMIRKELGLGDDPAAKGGAVSVGDSDASASVNVGDYVDID